MRSLVGVFALGAAWVGLATPTISGLKVSTISPLGLAIDYTVSGAVARDTNRAIKVSMAVGGVTNVAKAIAGETNCVNGAHRVYWNTAEDGISIDQAKSKVSVEYGEVKLPLYLVIDLSGGSNATSYAVTYMNAPPSGGFNTTVYKTKKLVLRWCPAGADPLGRYTLTKDFYAGLFEVTQKQWSQVTGGSKNTYHGTGDTYPIHYLTYNDVRGSSAGAKWPSSSAVDSTSFIGKLRAKTKLVELDLPTEAQWEYACRAGTTTTYNVGDTENALAGAAWYSGNANKMTHTVGQKMANGWGLYDMHGNVWEWCLDGNGGSLTGSDPVGGTSYFYRRVRGGSWSDDASSATSSYRNYGEARSDNAGNFGFRVFMTVP